MSMGPNAPRWDKLSDGVVEAHPQEEWDERIGWLQTLYGRGQVCGLLGPAALTQVPLHTSLLAAASVTALAALTAWFTTHTPPSLLTPKPALLQPPRPSEWPVGSSQHHFHHPTRNALRQGWQELRSPF